MASSKGRCTLINESRNGKRNMVEEDRGKAVGLVKRGILENDDFKRQLDGSSFKGAASIWSCRGAVLWLVLNLVDLAESLVA